MGGLGKIESRSDFELLFSSLLTLVMFLTGFMYCYFSAGSIISSDVREAPFECVYLRAGVGYARICVQR